MRIKIIELFAGIGSPRKALNNLNIPHEVVAFSEIDKYAVEAYRAIHDDYETPNLGDIKEISYLTDCDLLTYGFPCQDISIAGYGRGINEGTRSGLLIEVERLLDTSAIIGNLPKVLILENVKALVQKKHRKDFDVWLEKLESLGYSNYWQVLNANDYGIPQNRERVFVVSILGEHKPYEFPEKQVLKLRLRDLLDDEVPENYYLKDEKVQDFISRLGKQGYILRNEVAGALGTNIRNNLINLGSLTDKNSQGERVYTPDIAVTQNANGGGLGAKTGLYLIGNINPSGNGQNEQVFDSKGLSPTLTTNKGEGIKVLIDNEIENPLKGKTKLGWHFEQNVYSENSKLCRTLKSSSGSGNIPKILTDCTLRIRRLTPNECWRLMGFSDEAYQKARIALNNKFYKGKDRANSQMYKQAGNSIVVNVLEGIFRNLYLEEETPVIQKLF